MPGLGVYVAACVLLAVAGAAKAARPADTARALSELASGGRLGVATLPRLVVAVRGLAAAEAALGVAGLVYPQRILAGLVAASYVAFTLFVLYARHRGGALATCGCFGSPDTAATVLHAVVDAALAAAAAGVAVAAPTGTIVAVLGRQRFDGLPLLAAGLLTAALAYAVLSPLARLAALRHFDPAARP